MRAATPWPRATVAWAATEAAMIVDIIGVLTLVGIIAALAFGVWATR